MLSIAHTIISLPFGFIFQNPLLAFVAAFLMHLICDRMLHWNIYPHKMRSYPFLLVAIDVLGGVAAAYFITGQYFLTWPVLAAIAGGNMPDVLQSIWEFLRKDQQDKAPAWAKKLSALHHNIQRETDSIPQGLVSQVVLSAVAIYIIRFLFR